MSSPNRSVRTFRKIANEYLEWTYENFPEEGSALGLSRFDGELGKNTATIHEAQSELARSTLSLIEALPEAGFLGDDYLDRRGFLAMLRTHLFFEDELQRWRSNPQRHVDGAVNALFELITRNSKSLKRALPVIESRLAKIPAYLATGARSVRQPVPLWTTLAVRSCDGAVEFVAGLEEPLTAVSPKPARTARLLAKAKQAFVDYARLIARKTPGAKNGFSIGREGFEFLMRERLGFDQSLPEIHANGLDLIRQLREEMRTEARRSGFRNAEEGLRASAEKWNPDLPLIELYRKRTVEIRDRVGELGLVTLPTGESLDVLPVPPFLRHHFPTAAYQQPPAYSKRQVGIFWVNDLSLLQNDPSAKLAEIRQHYIVELTTAHEAYPGHHLQFAIQNRHPSKLRRLFAHAIFYEGWTLWCEKMCVDQHLVDLPGVRLNQLHDALWRAYRIIIDCGLHDGSLNYNSACRVLMDGVGFTRARAQGDVNWYTSSPTVPMSYLLGRLEVERLHAHFCDGEGWTLKQFNDWMLGHGALPWRWILEARMRGNAD